MPTYQGHVMPSVGICGAVHAIYQICVLLPIDIPGNELYIWEF